MNDVEAHLTTQRRSPIWPMLLNEWLPPVSAPATVHRVGYSCLESDRGRVGYGQGSEVLAIFVDTTDGMTVTSPKAVTLT